MKSENVDEKKGLIVRELARLSEITPAAAAASIVPARGDVGASNAAAVLHLTPAPVGKRRWRD